MADELLQLVFLSGMHDKETEQQGKSDEWHKLVRLHLYATANEMRSEVLDHAYVSHTGERQVAYARSDATGYQSQKCPSARITTPR